MKRVSLLATLALACAFTACKKDDDKPKTGSERLMAKSWKMTAWTYKEGNNQDDIYAALDPCSKDDLFKFKASTQFEYNEGANVCTGEPASYTGSWALTDGDKTLTIAASNPSTNSFVAIQGNVDELTADRLVVTETETSGGVTAVSKYTFVAQ